MNGLEEVRRYMKSFVCEKQQMQQQISKIEEKRTQLAAIRNQKKSTNGDWSEINELGRQISELGNQSQELQNQLDFKVYGIKSQMNVVIDNLVAENIRKIRIANDEIHDLKIKVKRQKEREKKYQLQKQEFYLRFGRMPELSEKAQKEKSNNQNTLEIKQIKQKIVQIEEELTELAIAKRNLKSGDWKSIIEKENIYEELKIEEICIEEIGEIDPIQVEEMETIEEVYIEEFKPIEEIVVDAFEVEEFAEKELQQTEIKTELEANFVEEIEELARKIVEEIAEEQTRDYSTNKVEEKQEKLFTEDIITFEEDKEVEEKKDQIIVPLFGQFATISNIIVKFEDGNLVYKAKMTDEKEIKIYPAQLGEENVLLRDKQNREECKEILINYAISEYKVFDKKVISKIDPLVCELLIECAERYGYDAQEWVYNYSMSFSDCDIDGVPGIIYNLSYIEQSNLSRKEKTIINRICKYARKNDNIDVIESFAGFKKLKYVLKRIFAVNNVKVLPEAKY